MRFAAHVSRGFPSYGILDYNLQSGKNELLNARRLKQVAKQVSLLFCILREQEESRRVGCLFGTQTEQNKQAPPSTVSPNSSGQSSPSSSLRGDYACK